MSQAHLPHDLGLRGAEGVPRLAPTPSTATAGQRPWVRPASDSGIRLLLIVLDSCLHPEPGPGRDPSQTRGCKGAPPGSRRSQN